MVTANLDELANEPEAGVWDEKIVDVAEEIDTLVVVG